jgi:hypothetical protein
MRNILQSKIAVTCLSAVAVLCVAANFLNLLQRQSAVATARENSMPVEEEREISYQVPPLSRAATGLGNWREMFPLETLRRDPFAAAFVPSSAAVTNTRTMPSFQLQAVSIAAGRLLAVINRRVVAEGESIEGCVVEKILAHEVRLVSPVFGPIMATFDRTPRQSRAALENKSASANPPSADLPAGPAAARPVGTSGTAR